MDTSTGSQGTPTSSYGHAHRLTWTRPQAHKTRPQALNMLRSLQWGHCVENSCSRAGGWAQHPQNPDRAGIHCVLEPEAGGSGVQGHP